MTNASLTAVEICVTSTIISTSALHAKFVHNSQNKKKRCINEQNRKKLSR